MEEVTIEIPVIATTSGPIFTEYCTYAKRLESFTNTPDSVYPSKTLMAKAGVFCPGAEGFAVCFYCNCVLGEWNTFDSPWLEHAVHSPECAYLILNKHKVETIGREVSKNKHNDLKLFNLN